jgi:hypothetical protein
MASALSNKERAAAAAVRSTGADNVRPAGGSERKRVRDQVWGDRVKPQWGQRYTSGSGGCS